MRSRVAAVARIRWLIGVLVGLTLLPGNIVVAADAPAYTVVNVGADGATWSTTQITTTPMHIGDICNLGIFCVAPSSNRNLLDFIQVALDPRGCAHVAYADDNTVNKLRAANQTAACLPR